MPLLMQYLSLVGARLVLLAIDNIAQRLAPKPAAPKTGAEGRHGVGDEHSRQLIRLRLCRFLLL